MPRVPIELFTLVKAVAEVAVEVKTSAAATDTIVPPKAKLAPLIVMLLPAVPAASPKETALLGVALIMLAPSNEELATTLVI